MAGSTFSTISGNSVSTLLNCLEKEITNYQQ